MEIKNINTLKQDVTEKFGQFRDLASFLDLDCSNDFIKGFHAGAKALQVAFLKAMENDELNYQHKLNVKR